MSNKETGGLAFPMKGPLTTADELGISIRDYFAAKALPIVSKGYEQIGEEFVATENYLDAAKAAYKMADAMLEARKS